jgi:integrase
VASLSWQELGRREQLWTLPSHRAKNKKPHLVPLSPAAIEILDEVAGASTWPSEGLVFSTTGKTSPSGFSKAKRKLDEYMITAAASGAERQPWRLHDLRRTVATGLQRLGARFEVTEAVLNHVSGSRGGIAGVYQRHDWAEEKRSALNAWCKHVNLVVGYAK